MSTLVNIDFRVLDSEIIDLIQRRGQEQGRDRRVPQAGHKHPAQATLPDLLDGEPGGLLTAGAVPERRPRHRRRHIRRWRSRGCWP